MARSDICNEARRRVDENASTAMDLGEGVPGCCRWPEGGHHLARTCLRTSRRQQAFLHHPSLPGRERVKTSLRILKRLAQGSETEIVPQHHRAAVTQKGSP